ncbi:MAG: hypothetical protein M3550_02540 [Actinomycetota bacterium]|nr:hypothetical protein [Actinomycetota bacterium]
MKKVWVVVALCVLILVWFAVGRLESQTGKQKALIVAGMNAEALQVELNSGWRVTHISGAPQQTGVGSWLVILER